MRSVLVVTGYLLATYGLLYWHCRSIMSPDGRFLLCYCYSIVIVTLLLLLLLLCRVSVCPLLRSPYSVLLGYITRVNGWTNGRVLRVLRSTVRTLELHILSVQLHYFVPLHRRDWNGHMQAVLEYIDLK